MKLDFLNRHKSIVESFFSLSILNALNIVLPLITLPYILRTVGMKNYGIYSYVYVLIQYLLLLNAYGFNYSATKQIAQNRDNFSYINKVYNSVIFCRFLLLFFGVAVFFLVSPFILKSREYYIMFIMGLGVIIGDIFSSVWLFQGLEKMRFITFVNLISKLTFTVLIFIIIRTKDDFIYIILLNSLGFIITGLLSYFIAFRKFKIRLALPNWSDISFQLKDGAALFGSTIGINLYRNANIFILNFFVSEAGVGLYATAEKIIKALQMVTVPITQALFPHLGHKFRMKPIKENVKSLFVISKWFGIFLLFLSIATFIFAPILVRILSGQEHIEAIQLVRIMSGIILLGGLNYLFGMVGLVNLNKQKSFFLGVMISGVISILFLILLVPTLGIISAGWSMLLSEILLIVFCMTTLQKLMSKKEVLSK